jgi:hypothetical protein
MGRENAASRAGNQIRLGCLEILDQFHVVAVVAGVAAHMMAGHGKVSR